MKCESCSTEQNISNQCLNQECQYSKEFTYYFCEKCKLHNNIKKKQIYHCDQCGICRSGLREEYFHCKKCNMCLNLLSLSSHKCLDNRFDKDCPVCRCNLFTSQSPVMNFKNCPHAMCTNCYEQYTKNNGSVHCVKKVYMIWNIHGSISMYLCSASLCLTNILKQRQMSYAMIVTKNH